MAVRGSDLQGDTRPQQGSVVSACRTRDESGFKLGAYHPPGGSSRLRWRHTAGLREHVAWTHALLAAGVKKYSRDEVMARFEAEDLLTAPVNDYDAMFVDPQGLHNEMVLTGEVPGIGAM
jgi:crotonobetainyl-CoA:carnitine CoA-transferase CaiB-like acyl-CoA transferase